MTGWSPTCNLGQGEDVLRFRGHGTVRRTTKTQGWHMPLQPTKKIACKVMQSLDIAEGFRISGHCGAVES